MENVGLYEYIRQKAPTDYKALKKKIDEFTKEGIELQRISSTIKQYLDLKSFCQTLNISNADYIDFLQAIRMARFLDAKFNSKESLDIMQKTLIYKSNEVCIFKPTNFKESNIIGLPEWCFSKSQGHWDGHYIGYHESMLPIS